MRHTGTAFNTRREDVHYSFVQRPMGTWKKISAPPRNTEKASQQFWVTNKKFSKLKTGRRYGQQMQDQRMAEKVIEGHETERAELV
jgi:hypothetical protein